MTQIIPNNLVARTPLSADFGHLPLGQLAGRSVTVGVPAEIRAGAHEQAGLVAQAPSLGSRILNALTPSSVRADSKVRQHLHDYSVQLSQTLGTLACADASDAQGRQKIGSALSALAKAAQPLATQGIAHSSAFQAQVDLRLGNMSQSELTLLRTGLADASLAGIDPTSQEGGILTALMSNASAAQTGRFEAINAQLAGAVKKDLSPLVEQLKQFASTGAVGEKFTERYNALSSAVEQLAQDFGPPPGNRQGFKDFQASLLKEALQTGVGDTPQDMGLLMNLWPADSLEQLVDAQPAFSSDEAIFSIERLITGQIGVRAERFETAVLDFGRALLSHDPAGAAQDAGGPLHDPQGLAKEITGFQQNLAALVEHNQKFDLKMDSRIDERLAAVAYHLEELLRPSNLNLGELSNRQLVLLRASLQLLGIERANGALTTEADSRCEAAKAAYGQTFASVIAAVQTGDMSATLTVLRTLTERGEAALLAFRTAGEEFDAPNQLTSLRANLLNSTLANLNLDTASHTYDVLAGDGFRVLIDGMLDVAKAALRANDAQGSLFFNASRDLQLLRNSLRLDLASRGVKLPDLTGTTAHGAGSLSKPHQALLQTQYGFKVDPGGIRYVAGLAPPAVQDSVAQNVAIGATLKPQGYEDTGVTGDFYRDLGRADFTLRQADNVVVSLVNREGFNGLDVQTKQSRRQSAVDQLAKFLGDDPALLLFVTNNIHQGLIFGLQSVMFSQQSPIQLEDGKRGQLSGEESIAYAFSRNDGGDVQVQVSYSVKNPMVFLDPATNAAIPIDPVTSQAAFTFAVTITPDRTIAMSEPVHFEYSVNALPT